MVRVYTLGREDAINTSLVGYRASDLAKIAQAKYPVPLSFIIPCSLFDEFLDASGIRARISGIYNKEPQTIDGYTRAYKELLQLFHHVQFSQSLKEELLDAYASLAIPNTNAADLVADDEDPTVILIPSPDYLVTPDRLRGALQNIKGKKSFLNAIKDCWASFFLPEKVMERQHYSIERASMAVVVQQQLPVEGSAEGHYRQKDASPIQVATYLGSLDILGEITKDQFSIAAEHLHINEKVIREQQTKLITGDEPGIFLQKSVGYEGGKQSLNDRQVLEVARLTKRAHVVLQEDINAFFSIDKEQVLLLFVLRDHQELVQHVESYDQEPEQEPLVQEDHHENVVDLPEQTEEVAIVDDEQEDFTPVTIVEDEPPVRETPVVNDSEETTQEEPHVMVVDELVDEEQEPMITDQEREETLFDLFQKDEADVQPTQEAQDEITTIDSSSQFINEVFKKMEEQLVSTYQEHLQVLPEHFDELVTTLREKELLPFSHKDITLIAHAHLAVKEGNTPSDEAVGVAFRLNNTFR